MSLHTLANNLQSAGRGEDKVLVHMTPGEVNGLQSIAMAHGGSLSINPETGLPEAGFLSSILPMIAGFALGPAGLGMTALNAGLASAAVGTALTGDLKKGLMVGLGAYGGAGLGAGLTSMGAEAGAAGANAGVAGADAATSAANSQIGNTLGTTTGQVPVFGSQPVVTGGGMTGFPTNVANVTPTVPTYAQTQANILNSPMLQSVPTATPPNYVEVSQAPIAAAPPLSPAPTTYPDISTMKPGGSYAQTGAGRYTITNPLEGSSVASTSSGAPIEVRNIVPKTPTVVRTELPGAGADASSQGINSPFSDRMSQAGRGFKAATKDFEGLKGLYNAMPTGSVIASGVTLADAMKPESAKPKEDNSLIRPYEFEYGATNVEQGPYTGSAERTYFQPQYTALTPYRAPGPEYKKAEGGIAGYQAGGQVEQMAALNAVGANTGYPMASLQTPMYSNPETQRPEAMNVIAPSVDAGVGAYTGEPRFATGGISHLGDYSDGGRLLKGPGDGVSDSIPASIGNRQPARLADGEFVIPARVVSELGNGSTEAGARKLYAMMDRVQKARRKTVGKNQVARNTKAEKLLPA